MKIRRLSIQDVVEITPVRRGDARGYFAETFRDDWFATHIADVRFLQENQSLSEARGVVRGLHFQCGTAAQGKLVRCLSGAVFDVAVDIRTGSRSFGAYVSAILEADAGNQVWIPAGFLHGFCTLTASAVVAYKVTAYYDPASDRGVAWNDPDIGIDWPQCADPRHLSPRDRRQPLLRDLPSYFSVGEVTA